MSERTLVRDTSSIIGSDWQDRVGDGDSDVDAEVEAYEWKLLGLRAGEPATGIECWVCGVERVRASLELSECCVVFVVVVVACESLDRVSWDIDCGSERK